MYYSLHGKELPGVVGKLDLQWVNGAPVKLEAAAPAAPAATATADGIKNEEVDTFMDHDDVPGGAEESAVHYSHEHVEDEDAY